MTESTASTISVLIVDDEPGLADLYGAWLEGQYDVRTATDAESAVELVSPEFDVLLIDRRMPGRSGDELLADLRTEGIDCPAALVTAVDPDVDILDMDLDGYLLKPVDGDDLQTAVEDLSERGSLDDEERETAALMSKKAVLRSSQSPGYLEEHEAYHALEDRLARLLESTEDSSGSGEANASVAGNLHSSLRSDLT